MPKQQKGGCRFRTPPEGICCAHPSSPQLRGPGKHVCPLLLSNSHCPAEITAAASDPLSLPPVGFPSSGSYHCSSPHLVAPPVPAGQSSSLQLALKVLLAQHGRSTSHCLCRSQMSALSVNQTHPAFSASLFGPRPRFIFISAGQIGRQQCVGGAFVLETQTCFKFCPDTYKFYDGGHVA